MEPANLSAIAQDLKHRGYRRFGDRIARIPDLFLMTDEERLPDPDDAIKDLLPGSAVVFRHYRHPRRRDIGKRLRSIARRASLVFIVAGDIDFAKDLDADGFHFPEARMTEIDNRKQLASLKLVSTSVHSVEAACKAAEIGYDFAFLSPVFTTASHPDVAALGLELVSEICSAVDIPLIGLGGINGDNAATLIDTGLIGLAAISGLAPNRADKQKGGLKASGKTL